MNDAPFSLFVEALVLQANRRTRKHAEKLSLNSLPLDASKKLLMFPYTRDYLVKLKTELIVVEVGNRTKFSAQRNILPDVHIQSDDDGDTSARVAESAPHREPAVGIFPIIVLRYRSSVSLKLVSLTRLGKTRKSFLGQLWKACVDR